MIWPWDSTLPDPRHPEGRTMSWSRHIGNLLPSASRAHGRVVQVGVLED